jgi:hypothetical protein
VRSIGRAVFPRRWRCARSPSRSASEAHEREVAALLQAIGFLLDVIDVPLECLQALDLLLNVKACRLLEVAFLAGAARGGYARPAGASSSIAAIEFGSAQTLALKHVGWRLRPAAHLPCRRTCPGALWCPGFFCPERFRAIVGKHRGAMHTRPTALPLSILAKAYSETCQIDLSWGHISRSLNGGLAPTFLRRSGLFLSPTASIGARYGMRSGPSPVWLVS